MNILYLALAVVLGALSDPLFAKQETDHFVKLYNLSRSINCKSRGVCVRHIAGTESQLAYLTSQGFTVYGVGGGLGHIGCLDPEQEYGMNRYIQRRYNPNDGQHITATEWEVENNGDSIRSIFYQYKSILGYLRVRQDTENLVALVRAYNSVEDDFMVYGSSEDTIYRDEIRRVKNAGYRQRYKILGYMHHRDLCE